MSSPEQRHSPMQQARKPRSVLAGQEGLEPPTTGFGDRDSSQLSYCPVMALPGGPATTVAALRCGYPRPWHTGPPGEPPPTAAVYVARRPGVEPLPNLAGTTSPRAAHNGAPQGPQRVTLWS